MDYGLDPCVVKSIGRNVVTSCPCIGDIKVLQTLFALSFASEVLSGLWVALYSFHGCDEKVVPCLLAPRLLFDVVVVPRTWSLIANLLSCELYHVSVYWFFSLVLGLSMAQSCSPCGLSLLCKAKTSLSLFVLHSLHRVWGFL